VAPISTDELIHAFARTKVDADGNAIDLRNPTDEESDIGAFDTVKQSEHRQRPRYDPETGELLTPIPVAGAAPAPAPAPVPVATPVQTLPYADANLTPTYSTAQIMLDLLRPPSLF